ncbi:hypothetical protein, conserved [Eimeria maxima]|uniref:JmjC domain-containing protein n=1 Tax=Eimeria maxima TaxID=5804 RepID=U6ME02_EIMMA|nr:hypothetical protein, conserved [Eimeria maxima]CDJ60669.1 hypothetical protein, conserved [Eimeria maxima]
MQLSDTHRECENSRWRTQVATAHRWSVSSSAFPIDPYNAEAGVALPLPTSDTSSPVHNPTAADEQVKTFECHSQRFSDRLSFPRDDKGRVYQGGAAFAPNHAWNHSGSGVRSSTSQLAKAPDSNESQGSTITLEESLNTTACTVTPRPSIGQIDQDIDQSNGDIAHMPHTSSRSLTGCELFPETHNDLQIEYKMYLKRRLEAVIRGVWNWRSESVKDFSEHHEKPFSAEVAQNAMLNGFTPYVLMHYASTTGVEESLKPLDMSVPGKRNIPFCGFSQEFVDSLCSGIGHGMMYYSVIPGSVFPIHCEQGGLGAFNLIVGALMSYTEHLFP